MSTSPGHARASLAARVEGLRERLARDLGSDASAVRVVVAPYRICPIGAHSDHQGGPVLGMAIDAYTLLAFAPAKSPELRLASENFGGAARFDLRDPLAARERDWSLYARAAAAALHGRLGATPRGLAGRVEGDLPGGGLSSSASVLLAYLTALAAANDVTLSPEEAVALSRRAENEGVGLASGILDPASIVGARRGRLLHIDTRAERWESLPASPAAPELRVLVAYSGLSRALPGTGFNARVEECRAAASKLARFAGLPETRHLGDLADPVFAAYGEKLSRDERLRAEHFFGERARVREGVACWRRGDLARFGALMNASCRSSIECYETGSPELVRLQEIWLDTPGVLGARFSGGGFGGCSVALVSAEAAESARRSVEERFVRDFPELAGRARVFVAASEDGLRIQ